MLTVVKSFTLKQKLWTIAALSFVSRVVVFLTLPNSPSLLGPDEGTYSALVKWIGESKPAREFPAYGEGLYLSGRSMIFPASILYRVGASELDSVRIVASVYGFCILILLIFFMLKLHRTFPSDLF